MIEAGSNLIYELAVMSKTCLWCRLSPSQKKKLVTLVREKNTQAVTLAIGDGANDVAMIQGAQVGIGLRGKEGNQAVQSCDIAISQFRFLVPLLMCHGRRNYRRVATFLCYFIYKHVVLAMGDIVWAHVSRFQGTKTYPEWLDTLYPAGFTALPVVLSLGTDLDIKDWVANTHPELYAVGIQRALFNPVVFTGWMFCGIWHGAVAWSLPHLLVGNDQVDVDSSPFWLASVVGFSVVIFNVSLRLVLVSFNRCSAGLVGSLALCIAGYFADLFLFAETSIGEALGQPQIKGMAVEMFSNGEALLALFLTPVIALLVDGTFLAVRKTVFPTKLELIRKEKDPQPSPLLAAPPTEAVIALPRRPGSKISTVSSPVLSLPPPPPEMRIEKALSMPVQEVTAFPHRPLTSRCTDRASAVLRLPAPPGIRAGPAISTQVQEQDAIASRDDILSELELAALAFSVQVENAAGEVAAESEQRAHAKAGKGTSDAMYADEELEKAAWCKGEGGSSCGGGGHTLISQALSCSGPPANGAAASTGIELSARPNSPADGADTGVSAT